MSENLKYKYDVEADVLKVEGIRYSGEFFRQLGHKLPLDTPMKITARIDGAIEVIQIEPGDPDWQGDSAVPAGHRGIFFPEDAPPQEVAAKLRELAAVLLGEDPTPMPRIILPAGHA